MSLVRSVGAARRRQHVVPLVLRRAVVDHGARRAAGQRRPRLHRRGRHPDHPRRPVPAGGVPRRRLASAVAGRPDPVVQGAPRRGGGARGSSRRRGGARRAHPAGRHDHGDARRVRHRHGGRTGMRGRRRAGHAGHPGSQRPGGGGQRRPRPTAAGAATIRCPCGCSTSARGWRRPSSADPPRSPRSTACPIDRAGPAYAELALLRGDPSDGLPGVPGVGEKTAATLLAQHGSLEAHPGRGGRPEVEDAGRAAQEAAGRDRLHRKRPAPVVRVATDAQVDFSTSSDALPLSAKHPRKVADLAGEFGVTSSIARLQKALDELPD